MFREFSKSCNYVCELPQQMLFFLINSLQAQHMPSICNRQATVSSQVIPITLMPFLGVSLFWILSSKTVQRFLETFAKSDQFCWLFIEWPVNIVSAVFWLCISSEFRNSFSNFIETLVLR